MESSDETRQQPAHLLCLEQLSGQQAVEGAVGGPEAAGQHQHAHVDAAASAGGARRQVLLEASQDVAGDLNVLHRGHSTAQQAQRGMACTSGAAG
jgi:hypothetical protein